MTTPPIIEAKALRRRFGKVDALNGLDLVAEPGQVVRSSVILIPSLLVAGHRADGGSSRLCEPGLHRAYHSLGVSNGRVRLLRRDING
jgi:hypothetical protein